MCCGGTGLLRVGVWRDCERSLPCRVLRRRFRLVELHHVRPRIQLRRAREHGLRPRARGVICVRAGAERSGCKCSKPVPRGPSCTRAWF